MPQLNFYHKRRWDKKKRALPCRELSTSRNFTAKLDWNEDEWAKELNGKRRRVVAKAIRQLLHIRTNPPKPPPKPENYLHLSLPCISQLHALSQVLTHTPDPGKSFLHEIVKHEKSGRNCKAWKSGRRVLKFGGKSTFLEQQGGRGWRALVRVDLPAPPMDGVFVFGNVCIFSGLAFQWYCRQ